MSAEEINENILHAMNYRHYMNHETNAIPDIHTKHILIHSGSKKKKRKESHHASCVFSPLMYSIICFIILVVIAACCVVPTLFFFCSTCEHFH